MEEQKTDNLETIKDILSEINAEIFDQNLIVDNKLFFQFNNESYRVHMPSPRQLSLADEVKQKLYGRLIKTEGYYLKNKLKKILKENQDLDIDAMEEEKEKISNKLKRAYLDLADVGTSKDQALIEAKKNEVNKYRTELINLDSEIINYLSHSIEDQLEKKYVEYLTFLCTEKLVDRQTDKWSNVWTEFEAFETDNSKLAIMAINHLTKLLLDSREI